MLVAPFDATKPMPLLKACSDEALESCGRLDECFPGGAAINDGDGGVCVSRATAACLAVADAGGATITSDDLEACANIFTNDTCAAYLLNHTLAGCAALPKGALGNGENCAFPEQCASGFCYLAVGAGCGKCQAPLEAGTPCPGAAFQCGGGLACENGRCGLNSTYGAGETCDHTHLCAPELSCVTPLDAGDAGGMCETAAASVDAGCDPAMHHGPGCDGTKSLYCTSSGACAAKHYATGGQPCGTIDGIPTVCTNASLCYPVDGGHMCIAYAADGQPCNTLTGPGCIGPALCVGTVLPGGNAAVSILDGGGSAGTCQLPDSVKCPNLGTH